MVEESNSRNKITFKQLPGIVNYPAYKAGHQKL